jgi:dipeptidyl aminopeptidase/acylaminoacyl peptidase
MNLARTLKFLFLLGAIVVGPMRADGEPSSATPAASLEPIAFLTTHEWEAKLPDSPDGKKMKIHAQFTWAQNRQAIRISNQFVTDGKGTPYIDGLYAWDPQRHIIVFWYVDAKGGLTEGTVKMENGKVVHEFEEKQPDGKTANYVARVTPHGDQAWENEIFARKGNDLTPIVKVRYEATN